MGEPMTPQPAAWRVTVFCNDVPTTFLTDVEPKPCCGCLAYAGVVRVFKEAVPLYETPAFDMAALRRGGPADG